MEDIRKQVESMAGDTPKHLGLVVSLDDIDKKTLSDRQKEEFNEIVSDLKKIGIKLEIDSGHLVLSYHKGKEGIINWGDYPITVPEEKVKNVKMEETKAIQRELDRRTELEQKAVKLMEQGNFEDANALLKSMDDSILKGLDNDLEFKNCDIQQSESAESVFSDKSIFSYKNLENCKFKNCSLFSCKLVNTEFVNTTFKNVTFYDCVLQNVKFKDCKFEKCHNDVSIVQPLKSENIKFVNTDIKDFRLNLEHADTNLDLKSVSLKKCSLENIDCYLIADGKYKSQSITKKVNSEQTFMKLLGRDLRKSIKLGETIMPKKKQRRAKAH